MDITSLATIIVCISALFSFLNARFIGMPTTIGVMAMGLLSSLCIIALNQYGFSFVSEIVMILENVDFNKTLMQGMLSFLLFAGALHVEIDDLMKQKLSVGILATISVIISSLIIGYLIFYTLNFLNISLPLIYCFILGALISPTDPIAVISILKQTKAPKDISTNISGESLFNDGIAILLFFSLLGIAESSDASFQILSFSLQMIIDISGGILLGSICGLCVLYMLRHSRDYKVEVLLTLALVMGVYSLAIWLDISAPIATVVSGLFIGNRTKEYAIEQGTREHIDDFWELVDEILNTILFVLIGLEMIVINFISEYLIAGLIAIPIVLISRFSSIWLGLNLLPLTKQGFNSISILTWLGLRGGISVALALSLPESEMRDCIINITYCVVVFSVLIQGLSAQTIINHLKHRL